MESDMDMISQYQPQPLDCVDGRCDVILTSLLYCVAVPVAVMAVFLVLLTTVMCCSGKSCKCKKYSSLTSDTNDIQMESYNTIRRASASLRYMSSQARDANGMGSLAGSSATLDRSYRRARRGRETCHSAPGTLQRQHRNRHSVLDDQAPAQPPPPPYNLFSEDGLSFGSEFLPGADMQTSVQSDCTPERNGNGAQPLLYSRHHPH